MKGKLILLVFLILFVRSKLNIMGAISEASYHTPFLFIYLFICMRFIFIYLFLAALGLHCGAWAFSSCSKWGLLCVVVHRLLIAVASLVVEHGL